MKKEEKKQAYVLCPRCELNYIKAKEKYCTVCKAEMGLVDPGFLLPDDEEAGEKLCPVCHVNYIGEDEEICFLCQKERDERDAAHKKDEWEDEGTETEEQAPIGIISLEDDDALLESSEEEPEEEEVTPALTEEDYDFVTAEELDAMDDEDFDDEDEDEDDDF